MDEGKQIEIRTEEVDELLAAVPNWIIRRGIFIVFSILLGAVVLSGLIKYPDVLTAKAIITTVNPPVMLVGKINGKITKLNVTNNQFVKKGDVLLVIENSADYVDVNKALLLIDTIQMKLKSDSLPEISIYDNLKMGDLTPAFIDFIKSYNEYKIQFEINPQEKEIEILDKDLKEYQVLQGKFQTQENTFKEEFLLIEKDYNRYTTLFQNQSISAKEYEDKKREYLTAKRSYESIKITTVNNKLTINNLEQNKLQLKMQAFQESSKFKQALNTSIQTLTSVIATWKQTYLLIAPIDGRISLFNYWAINQNLKEGDEVLSIVPVEKQGMIAKLFLPVQNSGKLKLGQKVNIKLNNYQFQEYGVLKGFIKNISGMPQKDTYAIEVALPDLLITSYKKQLDYKEEMEGSADIITEELSIFDRIFYQFRKILKN